MHYDLGLLAMLAAHRAAADSARRASIAAQQSQYYGSTYSSTGRHVDKEDWIAIAGVIIAIIVIIAVF